MEHKDIQDFLNHHTGKEWFDIDLQLFKKVFPHSKILKDLENVHDRQKAELDERMVYELLSDGGQCDCSVLENRGFTRDQEGFIVPLIAGNELNETEKELLSLDLDSVEIKYNVLKQLVYLLQLPTVDNKAETYKDALKVRKAALSMHVEPTTETPIILTGTDLPTMDNQTPEAPVIVPVVGTQSEDIILPITTAPEDIIDPEKKSEGLE